MRKTLLFFVAFLCTALASQAQITKGSLFLGGSFGLSTGSSKSEDTQNQESKSFGWGFSPEVGKAIADNKIIGLSFSVGRSKNDDRIVQQRRITESSNLGASVFYRQYFPLSARFYLFGESNAGFYTTRQERNDDEKLVYRQRGKGVSADLTPGISYAASRKLHLETSLNRLVGISYGWSKSESFPQSPSAQIATSTQKGFGISGNGSGFTGLAVGLRWILPRKS